ncbi:MAG: hypothetical protein B7X95_07380 [Methylophilaceae bacterium 17-44-8]|nr:MAG: hypothetical protein B7Y48_07725 [Methylophilales bacterium 28-44-11]OYZ02865.1 MAG: hypothetical protein B7Y32_05100 [Methylophilales bacterium 16-45-7]OZA05200.1 MAG: hypothetical protein B7X95_07380 [Methylophilaceae bacterium 17-44-8]
MDAISSFALASGLSWASGFRMYATVFAVGLLSRYEYLQLPQSLDILRHPVVIAVAGILMLVEFFADKIPYVDSVWDSIQTFIRIPAGAFLAMGAINTSDPLVATIAALLGGSLTGITHATKAGSRALINTSPEPMSNVTTSLGEDGLWLSGGWLALAHPMVFVGALLLLVLMMLWMLPKLWRGIKLVFKPLIHLFKVTL